MPVYEYINFVVEFFPFITSTYDIANAKYQQLLTINKKYTERKQYILEQFVIFLDNDKYIHFLFDSPVLFHPYIFKTFFKWLYMYHLKLCIYSMCVCNSSSSNNRTIQQLQDIFFTAACFFIKEKLRFCIIICSKINDHKKWLHFFHIKHRRNLNL